MVKVADILSPNSELHPDGVFCPQKSVEAAKAGEGLYKSNPGFTVCQNFSAYFLYKGIYWCAYSFLTFGLNMIVKEQFKHHFNHHCQHVCGPHLHHHHDQRQLIADPCQVCLYCDR